MSKKTKNYIEVSISASPQNHTNDDHFEQSILFCSGSKDSIEQHIRYIHVSHMLTNSALTRRCRATS